MHTCDTVLRRSALRPAETGAVFGAVGGLGLPQVMMCAWSHARVVAVDIVADKLDPCRKLGADAVVIGRLAAYGLAAAGETGVRRVIELLTEELRTLMILAGVPDIAAITPGVVGRRRASIVLRRGQEDRDQHHRQPGRTARVHQDPSSRDRDYRPRRRPPAGFAGDLRC